VWDDLCLSFQTEPKTIAEPTPSQQGRPPLLPPPVYYYAMAVFRRPVSGSPRLPPALVLMVTLEPFGQACGFQWARPLATYTADAMTTAAEGTAGPFQVGLVAADYEVTLRYDGTDVAPHSVRDYFINVVGRQLGMAGEPRMIGSLADARGHPETGMPAASPHPPAQRAAGCGLVLLAWALLSALGVWAWGFAG